MHCSFKPLKPGGIFRETEEGDRIYENAGSENIPLESLSEVLDAGGVAYN